MTLAQSGTPVRFEFIYRAKNGQAQTENSNVTETPKHKPVWETCEISYDELFDNYRSGVLFIRRRFHFCADALGPSGHYCAAVNEPFDTPLRYPGFASENIERVQKLVNKLLQEGWEQDGQGTYWFSYRFRRGC